MKKNLDVFSKDTTNLGSQVVTASNIGLANNIGRVAGNEIDALLEPSAQ
jgi:hypothetical protein